MPLAVVVNGLLMGRMMFLRPPPSETAMRGAAPERFRAKAQRNDGGDMAFGGSPVGRLLRQRRQQPPGWSGVRLGA